jgi:pimeloyl-ACP methyl ester carboxylesterase
MGGIIAMAYAGAHPDRLTHLVINDIGPDVEVGSQRITQMVGSRPDEFGTLDDAMAYRRQMSPIVAGRALDDQRELALGVLRQRPDGRWIWKMDPAYIEQRVRDPAARAPRSGPLCSVDATSLVVRGAGKRLSEAQARRMVDTLADGEPVTVPGVGHAPTLVERRWSPPSSGFLARPTRQAPERLCLQRLSRYP